MKDCVFCKIVNKEIPASIFRETDEYIAFTVTEPNNFGHSIVVPKKHLENIYSFDGKTAEKLGEELKIVSLAIKNAVKAEGINIHMNNEKVAGQAVFHAHIHIIPRFSTDGLDHWKTKTYENDSQKQELADNIKKFILA